MQDLTNYEEFKSREMLKKYLQLKSDPLQFLFDGNGDLVVSASYSNGETYRFSVIVRDYGSKNKPWDCKISSFSANLWMRTNKGVSGEKYASLPLMLSSIRKIMAKAGLTVESWIIEKTEQFDE